MREQPYEKLKFYQVICEIRKMVYSLTEKFDRSNLRLVSQMKDAARSAKQNIREGYRRGSLGHMINGIRISQGSLEELSGDMEDCAEDKLITENEYKKFEELYQSAMYLSSRYIQTMSKSENKEKWKTMGKE
ncbi:MAG: hypothetical protein A2306_10295 [Omnitrophica WOR_2 bacterium RIFOXYB2_FULL_38_16]|nr:MAG: hypothetical protein A2243_06750 [Omnitrophica WOR_2 bacterium RIFOXYA2_FULL_38_17]OGX58636.1 MAG: hypothetical protein A2306_10295 [Omnitrophica WOR_2 bacterium RIFOXYB2_FULL_38_16]